MCSGSSQQLSKVSASKGLVRWVMESDDGDVTSVKEMPRGAVVVCLDDLPVMLTDPAVLGPELRERIRLAVSQ